MNNTAKAASTVEKTNPSSPLFLHIVDAIKDKKGENIVALDLRNITEAVADFFIICEADNHLLMEAIVRNVIREVAMNTDEEPYQVEEGKVWSLVDYANIVVHVFHSEERRFYDLEGVWSDAGRMEFNS